MATLQDVRARYPQYSDLSDDQLATAMHRKYYADMPFDEFSKRIEYAPAAESQPAPGVLGMGTRALRYGMDALAAAPRVFDDAVLGVASAFNTGTAGMVEAFERTGKAIGDTLGEATTDPTFSSARSAWDQVLQEFPEAGPAMTNPPELNHRMQQRYDQLRAETSVAPNFEASDASGFLREQGQELQGQISPETRKAISDSQITGSLLEPSKINFGRNPNALGYGMQILDTGAQMVPTVLGALLTRRVGAGAGMQTAVSAASSAAQTGGAAGYEEEQRILNMEPQELYQLPMFADLIEQGVDPEQARIRVASAAGQGAFKAAAPVGAIGGLVTGSVLTAPGQKVLARVFGESAARRAAGGAVLEATGEAIQEPSEGVAQRAGAAAATGDDRDVFAGTAGEAAMGFLGGGGPAVVGALTHAPGAAVSDMPAPADDGDARFSEAPAEYRPPAGDYVVDAQGNAVPRPPAPADMRLAPPEVPVEPGVPVPAGPREGAAPADFIVNPSGTATRPGEYGVRAQERVARSGGPGMGPAVEGAPTMAAPDMAQAAFDSTLEVLQQETGKAPTPKLRQAIAERIASKFGGEPGALIERNLRPVKHPDQAGIIPAGNAESAAEAAPDQRSDSAASGFSTSNDVAKPARNAPLTDEQLAIDPSEKPEAFGLPKVMKPRKSKRWPKDFDEHHDDVLDFLALQGGLNREEWERQGVDPGTWNSREAQKRNRPFGAFGPVLLRKGAGLTPSEARLKLEQNGFLQQDRGQGTTYDQDAVDMVMGALNNTDPDARVFNDIGTDTQSAIRAIKAQQADVNHDIETAKALGTEVDQLYDEASRHEAIREMRRESVVTALDGATQQAAVSLAGLYQAIIKAGGTEKQLDDIDLEHPTDQRAGALHALLRDLQENRRGTQRQTTGRRAEDGGRPNEGGQAAPAGTSAGASGRDRQAGADGNVEPDEVTRLRARVSDLESQLNRNPVTRLPDKVAFDNDASLGWSGVSAIDMDGLGRLNDHTSHEEANKVLRAVADAMRADAGDALRFYHLHGDEFAARFKDPAHGEAVIAALQDAMARATVELNVRLVDGSVREYAYDGIGITFGVGADYAAADANASASKQQREATGERLAKSQPGAPRQLRDRAAGTERRDGDDRRGPDSGARSGRLSDAGPTADDRQGNRGDRGGRPGADEAVDGSERAGDARQDDGVHGRDGHPGSRTEVPVAAVGAGEVAAAAAEAATSPTNDKPATPAMLEAGNYAKGHLRLHGLDISIENPAGTKRRPEWPALKNHYGYIRGTEGRDGEHIDVFLSDKAGDPKRPVFVIDQIDPKTGKFDEHKVMMGWPNELAARGAYRSNYTPDWKGLGKIRRFTIEQFKVWLADGNTKRPAAAVKDSLTAQPAATGKPDLQVQPAASAAPTKESSNEGQAVQGNTGAGTPRAQAAADEGANADEAQREEGLLKPGTKPLFSRAPEKPGAGVAVSDLQRLAASVTAPGVKVTVVADPDGLPAAAKLSGYRTAEAWTDGQGHVFLVASNLRSVDRARVVLTHEITGHIGVERVIGEDWPAVERTITSIRGNQALHRRDLADAVRETARRYPNHKGADFAKEAVTVMAERGVKGSLWDRIVAAVRRWLRKTFNRLQWSESEIRDLLRRGAEAVSNPVIRKSRTTAAADLMGAASQRDPDQTETPEFKRWFGDSKVVDAQGRPLVVHHGTERAGFAVFDPNMSNTSSGTGAVGFYFTNHKLGAETYSGTKRAAVVSSDPDFDVRSDGEPGNYAVYLSMQNPLEIDFQGGDWSGANEDSGFGGQSVNEIAEYAERAGFDGVIAKNISDEGRHGQGYGWGDVTYIVFDSTKIKSATGNRGTFDPADPSILHSQPAGPFYSALVESVDRAQGAPKRGTAQQWKEWLDGAQRRGEFKQSEREWLGVDAWLDGQGEVTRAQLQEFVRANQVQVQETVLGNPAVDSRKPIFERYQQRISEQNAILDDLDRPQAERSAAWVRATELRIERDAEADAASGEVEDPPKFAQWQLPGGSNYRELLIRLPEKDTLTRTPTNSPAGWGDTDGGNVGVETRGNTGADYRSSHFDQPNILAHVRFNERTDADGKRVLFVEEVQSDWHQAGRRKGYRGKRGLQVIEHAGGWTVGDSGGVPIAGAEMPYSTRDQAQRELDSRNLRGDVPDAPLKKEWPLTAMKRVIRYAAENGFDRVAWTTGAQQADRYDLSKQVKRIDYDDRTGNLVITDLNGRQPMTKDSVKPEDLPDIIGKEAAEKLMHNEDASHGFRYSLQGDGLRVGGEGMKAFYDKMLPAEVGKYVKQWGAKVGEISIKTGNAPDEVIARYANQPEHPFTKAQRAIVHSINITPQMRDAAMEGQPLFSQPNPNNWDAPTNTRLDNFLYEIQDRHVDTKRAQAAIEAFQGAPISDDVNVYARETVYHGRADKRVKDFLNKELRPLLRQLDELKVTMEQLEHFLHARHAPERNERMAERNPSQSIIDRERAAAEAAVDAAQPGDPNLGKLIAERTRWRAAQPFYGTEEQRLSLSGMSDQAAALYMNSLSPAQRLKMDTLAARVDKMVANTRKLMVAYGLDSQDSVDAMEKAYQYYVPLMRADMDHGHASIGGSATGFSVKGASVKAATGSNREVVDILANLALQRERVTDRGEKNRVANAVIGLARSAPNPDFWTVDSPPMRKRLDPKTGFVVSEIDPGFKSRDNVLTARVLMPDGSVVEQAVVFNEHNERAMRMAHALKNLDGALLSRWVANVAKVTRFMAAMSTQWNVIFGLKNFQRDVQSALINLGATELAEQSAEIANNIAPALLGVYRYVRARKAGQVPTDPWSQAYERMLNSGGQTGFRDMFHTSEERGEDLRKEISRASSGKVMRGGRAIVDWISDYNEAIESSVRLAVYEQAIKSGLSPLRAANIDKDITTNFNRKGASANHIGAFYAFFNATVQGNARIIETLTSEKATPGQKAAAGRAVLSKLGKKVMLGGIAIGIIQALMLAAAGFDDDDPPQFVRERNYIIPTGNGKYVMFPMPLGFNILPNIGRLATEALLNRDKPADRTIQIAGIMAEAANPIGSAGVSIQTVLPTVADPFAALEANRDWNGQSIYQESFNPMKPEPGFKRARAGATDMSIWAAEMVNSLFGGTAHVPAKIKGLPLGITSPSPDAIDYLVGQAFGGTGRELLKAQATASALFKGEELPPYKVVLAGNYYGDTGSLASATSRFYDNVTQLNDLSQEMEGRAGDPDERATLVEFKAANPLSKIAGMGSQAASDLSAMKKARKAMEKSGATHDQLKAMDDQIEKLIRSFNAKVESARG